MSEKIQHPNFYDAFYKWLFRIKDFSSGYSAQIVAAHKVSVGIVAIGSGHYLNAYKERAESLCLSFLNSPSSEALKEHTIKQLQKELKEAKTKLANSEVSFQTLQNVKLAELEASFQILQNVKLAELEEYKAEVQRLEYINAKQTAEMESLCSLLAAQSKDAERGTVIEDDPTYIVEVNIFEECTSRPLYFPKDIFLFKWLNQKENLAKVEGIRVIELVLPEFI